MKKLQLGEDSVLEFKSLIFRGNKIVGPSRESLADELAAFANTDNGVLLLGVHDKTREIEGIPIDKLDAAESYIREICSDSINPSIPIKNCSIPWLSPIQEKNTWIKWANTRLFSSPSGMSRKWNGRPAWIRSKS